MKRFIFPLLLNSHLQIRNQSFCVDTKYCVNQSTNIHQGITHSIPLSFMHNALRSFTPASAAILSTKRLGRPLCRAWGNSGYYCERLDLASLRYTHAAGGGGEKPFSTADLCDAHEDSVEVVSAELAFQSFGGRKQFYGQIVTIKCHEDNTLVKQQVAQQGQGKVLVVDGGGSKRCALLGDLLAKDAEKNRWEGIIIWGCIRDSDVVKELNVGVKALGTHPKKSFRHDHTKGLHNIEIKLGGVVFKPGHYVFSDSDGIIVSPKDLLA